MASVRLSLAWKEVEYFSFQVKFERMIRNKLQLKIVKFQNGTVNWKFGEKPAISSIKQAATENIQGIFDSIGANLGILWGDSGQGQGHFNRFSKLNQN